MAAPAKYPQAHVQLRVLATAARREGLTFDAFWERAIRPDQTLVTWATAPADRPEGAVVWPRDTDDRRDVRTATLAVESGWRRAYDREPSLRREVAVAALSPLLDSIEEAAAGGNDDEAALSFAA